MADWNDKQELTFIKRGYTYDYFDFRNTRIVYSNTKKGIQNYMNKVFKHEKK